VTFGLKLLFVPLASQLDLRLLLPEHFFDVGLDGLQLFFAFLTLTVFGISGIFRGSQIFDYVLDSLGSRNSCAFQASSGEKPARQSAHVDLISASQEHQSQ
jgi:hypothetical protein